MNKEDYLWVARDKDNTLAVYNEKPERDIRYNKEWLSYGLVIDSNLFPNLKWEDEPLAVVLQQAIFKSK